MRNDRFVHIQGVIEVLLHMLTGLLLYTLKGPCCEDTKKPNLLYIGSL